VGVDTSAGTGKDVSNRGDALGAIRPQAGNDAEGEVTMRARRGGSEHRDYLTDAFALLDGWTRNGREISRTLRLDDRQHVALTERIKIAADALRLRADVRRLDGYTQIRLHTPEDGDLSAGEVALAARIEDLYRTITGAA
jgi:4a-hydroxytetrahydrobiopterin dehydratase